ncbi:MAG: hypothetical protein GW763_17875 [Paraglaciecola sp.]|nr:hypothetical protein [Paraglaciecola sp.]NCT49824.1 hypothetical protein [Paraglaciecola sp.]
MDRSTALKQIVTFGPERELAISALVNFGYDSDEELFEISESVLIGVLKKYIADEVTSEELEEWANFIECREDLNYEKVEGYIYALANPILVGMIDKDKIKQMLKTLNAT